MSTPEQIKPVQKYNRLAITSFLLGLLTMIFPLLSIYFLVAENGGSGYLQSLFCGIPVMFTSIITGAFALVELRWVKQKGSWMAVVGIVFSLLYFVIFWFPVVILIAPYLFGGFL